MWLIGVLCFLSVVTAKTLHTKHGMFTHWGGSGKSMHAKMPCHVCMVLCV